MKIYLYAIINSNKPIKESIRGLKGSSVYNIPHRNIGIVVSNLNGQVQDISSDRAVEHEVVVERLMEDFTVLPVRFHTIFNSKRKLLTVISDYYKDFRKNVDRLCNKVEFGIKVIWSGDAIKENIINSYTRNNRRPLISGDSPGKNFIKEKFKEYKIDKEFKKEADRNITIIDNFFSGIAAEKRLEKLQSENLLLSTFYLIEKEKQDDFRRLFEQLKSTHSDFKYLFSGPWPPYNFIILRKKHIRQSYGEADDIPDGMQLSQT